MILPCVSFQLSHPPMLHGVHQHFRFNLIVYSHALLIPFLYIPSCLTHCPHCCTFMGADKSESLGLMDCPVSSPFAVIYPSFYVTVAATEQHHLLHFPEGQCNKGNRIYPEQPQIFISSKIGCLKQFR